MGFGASILGEDAAMDLGTFIVLGILFAIFVVCSAGLVYTIRLHTMHDVRNDDGQYSWMVPNSWVKIQENLIETQKLMAGSLAELTVHNQQISKLLGVQTDATLAMFEELKRMRGDQTDVGK